MKRKNNKYEYPEYIDRDRIEIEGEVNKRYKLSIPIDKLEINNNLVVILQNPSRANKYIADSTVKRVINYIHKYKNDSSHKNKHEEILNIGKIIILNLIPIYETYPDKIINHVSELRDIKNIETIKQTLEKNKTVIIAWGDEPIGFKDQYDNLTSEILKLLSDLKCNVFHVGNKSKNMNPGHGSRWGYQYELKKNE